MTAAFSYRVGRVIRPHGMEGELLVQLFRARAVDAAAHKRRPAAAGDCVVLAVLPEHEDVEREAVFQLSSVRWLTPQRLSLRLAGVPDRTAAEALIGAALDLDPDALPAVLTDASDAAFGAEVLLEDGSSLGKVRDIRHNGAQAILLVGEEELMIPFVEAFVLGVEASPDGRRVRVRTIPGLLEANAAPPPSEPSF